MGSVRRAQWRFLSGPTPTSWHEVAFDRLPLGIAFGLLACCLFVAFQRLWNSQGTTGRWVINLFLAAIIGDLLLLWMISIFSVS
jgi:O-antigen/teichoic acid export membrane protein